MGVHLSVNAPVNDLSLQVFFSVNIEVVSQRRTESFTFHFNVATFGSSQKGATISAPHLSLSLIGVKNSRNVLRFRYLDCHRLNRISLQNSFPLLSEL